MRGLFLLAAVLFFAACSSPPAPVVERSGVTGMTDRPEDGNYHIRRGDTLHGIAFRYGLDHRELASWNSIKPPYLIYPDQVLRLTRPARVTSRSTAPARPTPSSGRQSQAPAQRPDPEPAVSVPVDNEPAAQAVRPEMGDPASWVWPVDGRLLRGFLANDPARNGLDISGTDGQDIKASAAGIVVYSGNGLIGFGELIIIKHSERMLSAYAHNRKRLVMEGATVSQGQKIAELGRNDRNEPILHFEIRVSGRPADPRIYLPVK